MEIAGETINQTLVKVFNNILRIEETKLKSFGADISIREAHVIEAVVAAKEQNSATEIAARLNVTVGSLTVAITTLERKGYVLRKRSLSDKRKVEISPTEKALRVNALHEGFHNEMTQAAIEILPKEQLHLLVAALENINAYFMNTEEK